MTEVTGGPRLESLGYGVLQADGGGEGMIRECRAGDVERIKRWTEAEGGRSLFWLAMLDDVTPEVILEGAVWRIAGRDGQLEGLGCSSFLRQQ